MLVVLLLLLLLLLLLIILASAKLSSCSILNLVLVRHIIIDRLIKLHTHVWRSLHIQKLSYFLILLFFKCVISVI
jgi:hypothetical protein